MRFTRTQFTIRGLLGLVAVMAILIGGVILLLRDSAATQPPPRAKNDIIMEGVDINESPMRERPTPPTRRFPPEGRGGRQL